MPRGRSPSLALGYARVVAAPIGVLAHVGDTLLIPISVSDPDGDSVTLAVRVVLTPDELASGYCPLAHVEYPGPRLWFSPRIEDRPVRECIVIGHDGRGLADTAWINVVVDP